MVRKNCKCKKLEIECACPHKLRGGKMKSSLILNFVRSSYTYPQPEQINNYKLDKKLTTNTEAVYWDAEAKKGVVSVRPTHTLNDVLVDIKAGLNINFQKDKRFTTGWATLTKAGRKYGFENLIAIGYSLGAIVVNHYKDVEKFKEVFLVSLPVLPVDIWKGKKVPSNATEIRSKFDPTSLLKPWQEEAGPQNVVVTATSANPIKEHKVSHFFKQIDPQQEIGLGSDITKMKVAELKQMIKKLRRGKAKEYKLTGKKKSELIQMIESLMSNLDKK